MKEDWSIYEQLRDEGASPHEAYWHGERDGLQRIVLIRMLIFVYSLDVDQAKEVMVQADGFTSLNEYQEKVILPTLKQLEQQGEETQC